METQAAASGKYAHLEWLDLEQNGVLTECAIMKKLPNGDVYYFPINSLDSIDKQRLRNILVNRNAKLYELWDLMSQITLGNGINALTYFNQLVKVRTTSGAILPFGEGKMGAPALQAVVARDAVSDGEVAQATEARTTRTSGRK